MSRQYPITRKPGPLEPIFAVLTCKDCGRSNPEVPFTVRPKLRCDRCLDTPQRRAARFPVSVTHKLQAGALNDFTVGDWLDLLDEYDYRCAYCGWHVSKALIGCDHKLPLCRGGGNTKANIVPACRPCNISKGDRTVKEFLAGKQRPNRYWRARQARLPPTFY